MRIESRAIFLVLMSVGFFCGFMHLFKSSTLHLDFERLHIFLFNLCCGGTLILYYTENRKRLSFLAASFLLLAIFYAILAFFEVYPAAMAIALLLAAIVEKIRIDTFSFLPSNFFTNSVPISVKFHHAALLCLSLSLLLSVAAIINEVYYTVTDLHMVKLNTFFLGFSFPVSLVTMSLMFALIQEPDGSKPNYARQLGFWVINIGVIVFFLFILAELLIPQVIISILLFLAVVFIFFMFNKVAARRQTTAFLRSGMFFLMFTGITGVVYILLHFFPAIDYETHRFLLRVHVFSALYGWNLSGLAVICRFHDFPIRLSSSFIITFHWITVLLLAPLGYHYKFMVLPATISYVLILYMVFFSRGLGTSH